MPRSTKSFGNNKLLADMSALIKDMGVFGIKHYVVHNSKFSYYIYLFDFNTKELLTVLEAEEIGKFRTAAVTSLVIEKLRTIYMKNLSIIGTIITFLLLLCFCSYILISGITTKSFQIVSYSSNLLHLLTKKSVKFF